MRHVEIGDTTSGRVRLGEGLPLLWITGPCVIENQTLMAATAERLKKLSEKLSVPLIFKSSYLKDNRSDELSYQGPGLEDGARDAGLDPQGVRAARAVRRAQRGGDRGGARSARRDPDPGVPVPADDPARRGRQDRASP